MSFLPNLQIDNKTDINYTISHFNEYGDGIGAPHNVVQFDEHTYEWTLIHGD